MDSGKVWFNGDGTVTNPDGSVVPEKKRKTDGDDSRSVKFAMTAGMRPEECLFDFTSDKELYEIRLSVEEIEMPPNIDCADITEVLIASENEVRENEAAIIDTGCSKAVGGSKWVASYLKTLDPEDRKHLKRFKSKAKFKFGNGKTFAISFFM